VDREGALELLDAAASEARASGREREIETFKILRKEMQNEKTEGGVLRGPDGQLWGVAIWDRIRGLGRRVSPIFVPKDRQNASGWRQFLQLLLDRPDPAGSILLFNAPLPGFAESEAGTFLAPWGFRPYHRFGLAFPSSSALPREPSRPLAGGRLRQLSISDLEPLAVLSAACYAGTVDRFLFGEESDPLASARTLLRALFDGRFGPFVPEASFGLELDGTLRGATLVTRRPTYKLLADVEVHPSVQRQGHARRLIRATLEALSKDAATPLALAVTEENGGAFQLYKDLGFVVQEGPFTFWANTAALGIFPPRTDTRGSRPGAN
jgi:GNAT superfamily N-acetyltransferase